MKFNNNKKKTISVNLSNRIIRSFESLLKIGNSIPSAIEILINVESGSTKKTLEKVFYNITKLDLSIGDALYKEGVIRGSEVFLINKSTGGLDAVRSILAIRDLSGKFENTIFRLFAFPVLAVIIGLSIAYLAQPTFYGMVNTLVEQVQLTKGIDIGDDGKLIWYLQQRDLTMTILIAYASSVTALLSYYFYLREFKPEIIYKYLPLKSYDDVPYILMLMYNLQKVGLDQVRVFDLLKKSSPKIGWIRLFDKLEKEAIAGRNIYTVFENFSFPKDVTLVLKSAEVSKTFWENMPALITYVQDTNAIKHKTINGLFGGLAPVVGFMIILYFVSGLFMAMFALQSLAMAMM